MKHVIKLPQQREIVLAIAGAMLSMVAASSQADCVSGGTVASSTNGNINWASGDCTVNPSIVVSDFFQQTALIASSTVGTLTNSGTLTGFRYGMRNNGTIGVVNNRQGGLISGESVSGIGLLNSGRIGALSNSGIISSGSSGITNNGSIGSLTNSGSILGRGGFGYTPFRGISNQGTIGQIDNLVGGTISGGSQGIFNAGTIGTLNNSGVISVANGPAIQGILNSGGGIISALNNNSGGLISGNTAINNVSGTILSLVNSGTITGAQLGIGNASYMETLTNNSGGTISGQVVLNNNGGTILSLVNNGVFSGVAAGILNGRRIDTLTNNAVISAPSGKGINNAGTITTLTNNSGGVVSGLTALSNGGSMPSVVNIGALSGVTKGLTNTGQIGSLTNSGTIAASNGNAIINSGTITSLDNQSTGTITGNVAALQLNTGSSIGTIGNAGLIAGNIINQSANDLAITGGTGAGFGTLTGMGGATSTITNTLSNLTFVSGNLLLNDNVAVGTFALNNSGATLQVNAPMAITGNYTQGAGAVLLIGVADGATSAGTTGDTGYGRLVVSGTATVAQGSSVTLQKRNTYGFAAGQRFVVIDALAAGTNYNAATLHYVATGVTGLVVTGAAVANGANSDLVVSLSTPVVPVDPGTPSGPSTPSQPSTPSTPVTPPAPVFPATVPNAVAALSGLFRYSGIADAGLLNLYNASLHLNATGSAADLNRAGKQLNPNTQAPSGRTAAAPTYDVLNIISRRADGLRLSQGQGPGSGVSTGESASPWSAWGQAFGGHANQGERDQIDGYSADYGGLLIGVDRQVSDGWRVGGVFSYSSATAHNSGDTTGNSTQIDAYGLFGYGSYVARNWYANVSAGVVLQDYVTSRVLDFGGFSGNAAGSFSGQQYVVRGEAGYPVVLGKVTVTPLAGLTYSYLKQNAFTESGGNGAALSVKASHTTSVTSDIGAKLEREFGTAWGTLVPELRMAWRHEYDNARVRSTANFAGDPTGETSFTTLGASPVADSALVSIGLTLLRADNLSLTVRYEGQTGGGYHSQAGSLRLRKSF